MLAITREADGFVLDGVRLNDEQAQVLAKALITPHTPGFATDKMLTAPVPALGLWLTPAGQLQLYLNGKDHDVSTDEAKALAETVLLASAKFKVGDEVSTLGGFADTNGDWVEPGTVGVVTSLNLNSLADIIYYVDTIPTNGIHHTLITAAPPVRTWSVEQSAKQYIVRTDFVSARTEQEAREVAFKGYGDDGWVVAESQKPFAVTFGDIVPMDEIQAVDLSDPVAVFDKAVRGDAAARIALRGMLAQAKG